MEQAMASRKIEGFGHRESLLLPTSKSMLGKEDTDPESSEDEAEIVGKLHKRIVKSWITGSSVDVTSRKCSDALLKVDEDKKTIIHRAIEQLRKSVKEVPESALVLMEPVVVEKPELFVASDESDKIPLFESAKHRPEILFRILETLIPQETVDKVRFRCRMGEKNCPLRTISKGLWQHCYIPKPGSHSGNLCTKEERSGPDDEQICLHNDTDFDKMLKKDRQMKEILTLALRNPLQQGETSVLQSLLDVRRFDPGQNGNPQLVREKSFRTLLQFCPDETFVSAPNHGYSPLQQAVLLYAQESLDFDLLYSIILALIDRSPSSVFFRTPGSPGDRNAYRMLKEMKTTKNLSARRAAEKLLKQACIGFRKENTAASLERLEVVDNMWMEKKDFLYWDPKVGELDFCLLSIVFTNADQTRTQRETSI
jgi:hypothetical protein